MSVRERSRIIGSLETVYRGAFDDAEGRDDRERMQRLDFDFQRDQLFLEVMLDVRDLLAAEPAEEGEGVGGLVERARALKDLTRLR